MGNLAHYNSVVAFDSIVHGYLLIDKDGWIGQTCIMCKGWLYLKKDKMVWGSQFIETWKAQ